MVIKGDTRSLDYSSYMDRYLAPLGPARPRILSSYLKIRNPKPLTRKAPNPKSETFKPLQTANPGP